MDNWQGRETADIVYTDRDGVLTKFLRDNCTGGFPAGIPDGREIEYFLEVKTTTGECNARFFMSSGQYQLVCRL